MSRIAHISIRRPKLVLSVVTVLAVALGLIGLGVVKSLSPTVTVVPGTESSRAQHLAHAKFGPSVLVPILLEGPKQQLDKQGPQLVRALVRRPHTRALTAWDVGSASAGLRPAPDKAMIVVSVDRSMKTVVKTDQPQIEKTVGQVIHTPVKSFVTGQAALDRAIKTEALHTTLRAGLIAAGVLFLLLLVGLRAPIAAAVVALSGAAIVIDSFGTMALAGKVVDIDPIGVASATMLGLALGAGLALMYLDRFREEELPADRDPRKPAVAAWRALDTAGRAVAIAAGIVIVGLLLANLIGPTVILTSLGFGATNAAVLALVVATLVMPAAATLFGKRMVTASVPAPRFMQRGWDKLVAAGSFVTRRAVIVGALATAVLIPFAIAAFNIQTGPPDPSQLPKDSHARVAFQEMQRVMGPGWPTPFNVIVASDKNPITSAAMLRRIDTFQRTIASDPRVDSVVGPAAIATQTKDLGKLPKQLNSSAKMLKTAPRDLRKLENGLGQAGAGSQQLQSGLKAAASGAGQLQGGGGQAQAGAGKLHAGLAAARNGSAQISNGLATALDGANALKAGAGKALAGSAQLTSGLAQAQGPVNSGLPAIKALTGTAQSTASTANSVNSSAQTAAKQTESALGALKSMGPAAQKDPSYGSTLSALEQANASAQSTAASAGKVASDAGVVATGVGAVSSQTSQLAAGLTLLHNGAGQLQGGIAQLKNGNTQLAGGIGKLAGGGGQLTSGLTQLRDGAGALQAGLGDLTNGAGQLQSGIAGGVGPTGQLVTGLGTMQAGVGKFAGQLPSAKDLEQLKRQSPGLFDSGYFVLAAVQGAPPAARNQATFAVNLYRGGTAGQIMVVSKYPSSDNRTKDLNGDLRTLSDKFAKQASAQVAVGGPAAELTDFESSTLSDFPWVVAGLGIAAALILMIALRAVLLPLVAVGFNMLAVAATFGLMKLLFVGSNPPLGGPGYVDPMTLMQAFVAAFGLSLVFTTMLLMRTREEFVRSGDLGRGLQEGMRHTAAAATGMGLVMLAAIVPFATSGLINIRQSMIAIAAVVLIDIVLVRPVLMPAAVRVLGPRIWWPTEAGHGTPSEEHPKRRLPHLRRRPRPAH